MFGAYSGAPVRLGLAGCATIYNIPRLHRLIQKAQKKWKQLLSKYGSRRETDKFKEVRSLLNTAWSSVHARRNITKGSAQVLQMESET